MASYLVDLSAGGFMRAPWLVVTGLGVVSACGDTTAPVPVYQSEIVAGAGQSGLGGDTLPEMIAVRVTDEAGAPHAGVSVIWSTANLYGALLPSESVTDADGIARSRWVLGIGGTTQTGTATIAPSHQSLTFHATQQPALRAVALMHGEPETHMCALDASQRAWCWGTNRFGELGNASVPLTAQTVQGPVLVDGNHQFTSLVGAGGRSCGLDTAHRLWCWGLSLLSDPDQPSEFVIEPTEAAPGLAFASVDLAWSNEACGVLTDGEAYCWGRGYLGDGQLVRVSATPVALPGGPVWLSVAIGDWGGCGIKTDHSLWCWGATYYTLPNLAPDIALSPVEVPGVSQVAQVDANNYGATITSGVPPTKGKYLGDPLNDDCCPAFDPLSALWATTRTIVGLTTDATIEIWGPIRGGGQYVQPVGVIPGSGWREAAGSDSLVYGILDGDSAVYALDVRPGTSSDPVVVASARAVPAGKP
jgi:hypothetical protein